MAYTALYREWRPKNFSEVVGEKHVTITLKNQIKNGKIAHAYLLCGTRGTGKTSTAKILSKAINCLNPQDGEPCNECEMCKKINSGLAVDVLELDAASHNSVDNIREIIEEVQYAPRESKYKVYIIDEVHMLSIGAVNAFLKTLEEPPANVVFILATTDPQKLPITILSRCQRFDFKRIKSDDIFDRLRKIVDEIGIYADDSSLKLISRICDGAMRDALSLLDQVISIDDKVSYEKVVDILGLVTNDNIIKLIDYVIDKDIDNSIKAIDDIVLGGKDIYNLIKDMVLHMRNLMMVKITNKPEEVLDMSNENIEILKQQSNKLRVEEIMRYIRVLQETEEQCRWSKQSRIFLELAIIKIIKVEYDTSKEVIVARLNNLEKTLKEGKVIINSQKDEGEHKFQADKSNYQSEVREMTSYSYKNSEESSRDKIESESIAHKNFNSTIDIDKVKSAWKDILDIIKSRREMIIYASLITGIVSKCENGVIEISYEEQFAFNKKRLEGSNFRKKVDSIFSEVLKEPVIVEYTVSRKDQEINKEQMIKDSIGDIKFEVFD